MKASIEPFRPYKKIQELNFIMKAIVLEKPGQLQLTAMEAPTTPGPGEALIRIHNVGVCGTDLHAFRGEQPFFTYPRLLGHELSAEIIALGPLDTRMAGTTPGLGARCALEPYFYCGHCPPCRRGVTNCCVNIRVFGVHIDGGMREFAIVPTAQLHPSSTLSFEQLALVEPLSIGTHAVRQGNVTRGETVLVVGAGPIGLSVAQFALLAGARVFVMDISKQRREFCQSQWPEIVTIDATGDALAALQNVVGDDLPTAVFDATGNPKSMMAAFHYAGHGGRLIYVGLFQGDITFHDPDFHSHELSLLSSRNATSADFHHVIAALEAGLIDIAPWITHRASPDTMIAAFPAWFDRNSGIIKAIVTF
jgi:2-desacetyl-2-hydroxyethyl bacteriochlorophyllide A dehydrogenase